MDWTRIRNAWTEGYRALSNRGLRLYGAAIRANPQAFKPAVLRFMHELKRAEVNISHLPWKMSQPYRQRYNDLAAGLLADSQPAPQGATTQGWMIIVGVIAVGVIGIAWAVVAYEHAKNLADETDLARQELQARVDASQQGRTLQSTTLPEPKSESPGEVVGKGLGVVVVGGLVIAGGAILLPYLLKRK